MSNIAYCRSLLYNCYSTEDWICLFSKKRYLRTSNVLLSRYFTDAKGGYYAQGWLDDLYITIGVRVVQIASGEPHSEAHLHNCEIRLHSLNCETELQSPNCETVFSALL